MTATVEAPAAVPIPAVGHVLTTMAEFEALPIGSVVRTTGSAPDSWVRVDDRGDGTHMWRTVSGATLPIRGANFSGAIAGGYVTVASIGGEVAAGTEPMVSSEQVKVGDTFFQYGAQDRAFVVVLLDTGAHECQVAEFVRNAAGVMVFHRMTHCSRNYVVARPRYPVTPDWAQATIPMAVLLYNRGSAAGATGLSDVPEALVNDLTRYGREVDDDDFDAILRRHNLVETDHRIAVRIEGTSEWAPTQAQVVALGVLAPDLFLTEGVEGTVQVRWSRVVNMTRTGRGCQCSTITDADVTGFVPPNTTRFTHTQTCR